MSLRHVGALAFTFALTCASACTTFDGLVAHDPGEDAAPPIEASAPDASDDSGVLPVTDAARVCMLGTTCPDLLRALRTSLGLPFVTLGDATTFSTCMQWLGAPAPGDRARWAPLLREVVGAVGRNCATAAQAATCKDAGGCTNGMTASCNVPADALEAEVSCIGSRVQVCAPGATSGVLLDCANVGGECVRAGDSAVCMRPNSQCHPARPDVDVCDGTGRFTSCIDGSYVAIDCGALGLGTCVTKPLPRCE